MIRGIDKAALLLQLRQQLEADLQVMQHAQRQSSEGATHPEARSEGDKDMRATEVSYLARGQAQRVVELTEGLTRLSLLKARSFAESDPVAMGALVALEDQANERSYFLLAPAGAGTRLEVGFEVVVLTASSPLGRSLLGQHVGDEVELVVHAKKRVLVVEEIA